ncbi:MAG: sulfatase/phosphatase domain-containing protein, partial [Actinomycetota bacterium]
AALQHEDPASAARAISMRTDRWTYVQRLYEGSELYDRTQDPHEVHNLSGTAEVAGVEREIKDQMLEWMMATSDVVPWQEDFRIDLDLLDIPVWGKWGE